MDNYIRGKYLALGFVRDIDLYGAHSACEAAAFGQKRPVEAWSKVLFIRSIYQSCWTAVGCQSESDQLRAEIPADLPASRSRARLARNV